MPPLLSRLYRDLAELHDAPYPGLAIFTDDANVRRFCLVLTPPAGPWKNLYVAILLPSVPQLTLECSRSLHFDVFLPENWVRSSLSYHTTTQLSVFAAGFPPFSLQQHGRDRPP